jgi:hypothetical protein
MLFISIRISVVLFSSFRQQHSSILLCALGVALSSIHLVVLFCWKWTVFILEFALSVCVPTDTEYLFILTFLLRNKFALYYTFDSSFSSQVIW